MARNEIRPIVKLRSTADTGYTYVTLDLEGFRSGNLNQALTRETT